MKRFIQFIFVLGSMCAITNLQAQEIIGQNSSHKGLNVGLHLGYFSNNVDDFYLSPESGFAIGGEVSYGILEWLAPIFTYQIAPSVKPDDPDGQLGNYSMSVGRIGVRFTPGNTTSKFRPFITAAYQFSSSEQEIYYTDEFGFDFILDDFKVKSSGFGLDGGLLYFINPYFSLKVQAQFEFGTTDEMRSGSTGFEITDELDTSSFSIVIGAQYNIAF